MAPNPPTREQATCKVSPRTGGRSRGSAATRKGWGSWPLTAARDLLTTDGILAGSSSGTLLAAALKYCQAKTAPKRVVTFACDSGNKYLSKMFNDDWMRQQGLITRPQAGDLSDYIALRHAEGATVTAAPDDTLSTVLARMRLSDISQLPVLENAKGEGIIDK